MADAASLESLRKRIADRRGWLYRLAIAWTGDGARADDLVQEALLKCLAACKELRDDSQLDAWLFSIMRNCWRDCFRDRWRRRTSLDEDAASDQDGPLQFWHRQQAVERVTAAVERLPEAQREVVALVDIEGFSYAEVAESLQIPVGTVMSRLCRARRRLGELLSETRAPTAARRGARIARFRRY